VFLIIALELLHFLDIFANDIRSLCILARTIPYKLDFTYMKYTSLVTGAAGFIGRNLVAKLLDMGCDVVGVDNLAASRVENLVSFLDHPRFTFIQEDIVHLSACQDFCKKIEVVFHQAALGSVPRSVELPGLYHENNSTGTLNMLTAARDQGVKRFVYASSSSVYGDTPTLPKIETMLPQPKSPYAITKITCEYYAKVFHEVYGLPTVGLRYFNVFGPFQNPDSQYAAVIPKFVTSLLKGEAPVIFGDGEQTRDFTFIDNVLEANLKSVTAPLAACGLAYNVGCGERISLNQLFNELQRIIGSNVSPRYEAARRGDVKDSLASIDLARLNLGYTGKVSLSEGLAQTVDWYRKALNDR